MPTKLVTIPLQITQQNLEALTKAHANGDLIFVIGISLRQEETGLRLMVEGSDRPENAERGFKAVMA